MDDVRSIYVYILIYKQWRGDDSDNKCKLYVYTVSVHIFNILILIIKTFNNQTMQNWNVYRPKSTIPTKI